MTLLPPSGFSDSRELIEAEQREGNNWRQRNGDQTLVVGSSSSGTGSGNRHGGSLGRLPIEAVETMLAR